MRRHGSLGVYTVMCKWFWQSNRIGVLVVNKSKLGPLCVSAALAATIGLVGCGGQQPQASASAQASAQSSTSTTSESASNATSAAAPAESTTSSTSATTPQSTQSTTTDATANSTSAAPSANTTASNNYIGDAEAKRIALENAGVNEADCTGPVKVELDTDDAVVHYDVDFKVGGTEYEYDIDAATGSIVQAKSEIDD